MKLYAFRTYNYAVPRFDMVEFDVEEKNKSYVCEQHRFNKTNIGTASGFNNSDVILLENNPSKAASILILAKERELEKLREQVQRKEAEIANLERYVIK